MEKITLKCEVQNFWQQYDYGKIINVIYVHFWLPRIKRRFREIPFPESIVCSDVVLDRLGPRYKPPFPAKTQRVKL